MRGLSLFSGIGGIDLAFEAAGGHVIAMCERDEFCQGILHHYWPDVSIHADIKTLRGEEIGAVDIIFGGFPCQPFSCAGAQRSKNDDRYLWPEFSRLVGEIRPSWVVAENVSGILHLAADDICEDLERQGYAVGIFHYEAAAVGALHRRARAFFAAHIRSGRFSTEHDTADSLVPNTGRWMCERGSIRGALRGEHGEKAASDAERSDSSSSLIISNTESGKRSEGTEDCGRRGKRSESRTRNRLADVRSALPDPNDTWRLQQEGGIGKLWRRACDVCKKAVSHTYCQRTGGFAKQGQEQCPAFPAYGERAALKSPQCGSRRSLEPFLGGVAYGFPCWLDGTWWQCEPDVSRVVPRGVPNRVKRLKTLGNAVVPAQIFPIFKAIMEIEQRRKEPSSK